MNFSILLLFVIFLMSASAIEYNNKTLYDWYEEVKGKVSKIRNGHKFYQFTRNLNYDCIKNKINFKRSQKIELNFAEAMILIYGARFKCMSSVMSDKAKYEMIDVLINFYNRGTKKNEFECFKMELKAINPLYSTSLTRQNMKTNGTACELIVDMTGFDRHIDEIERTYGKLSTLMRDENGRKHFKIILLTFIVAGENRSSKNLQRFNLKVKLDLALNEAYKGILKNLE
ncbi:hypothetical protein ACKWTF_014811 [Chironomus riparius]